MRTRDTTDLIFEDNSGGKVSKRFAAGENHENYLELNESVGSLAHPQLFHVA